MTDAKFIVFEGIDGSGKSLQSEKAYNFLKNKNIRVYWTNEPSEKGLRKTIKEVIYSKSSVNDAKLDSLLFSADRRYHIVTEIEPELEKGNHVICDRYYHSTLAYQSCEGLDLKWLKAINKYARKPDITIIFDLSAEAAIERIAGASRKEIENAKYENYEFLKKLEKVYKNLPEILPDEKIILIDGNKSIEEVEIDVKNILTKELNLSN